MCFLLQKNVEGIGGFNLSENQADTKLYVHPCT